MKWTPIKKKKPSEQIQEYLDSQKPGGRVLNTPVNRIQPTPQFPGNTPLRQTATQRPFFAGPTEVIHAPKAPDTTVHQGGGTAPNVVVTPEKPKTYEWTNVDQQMADLELAQKQAHIAAFADQMAAMDAEFWRIAQNPGSMLGANESPYYSLYMKQYEQRARDRETNAYTRASEGTGGYGSSFATMAGEQAYRETMQDFDELAPTLIKSKSERMAEILQEREMLKAMEQERLKTEAGASDGLTESASAAAQDLQSTWGTAFSEKTQREYLASKGYSEADINAALESQRKLASGTVTDYKAGTITNAVKQAQTLDDAYRQGELTVEEYDAAKAQNSKVIMDNVNKGMERIEDTDHAALGISDEEWDSMEDGEKKLAVFDRVGQLVKSGAVREIDYYKLLYNDLKEEFTSEEFKNSSTPLNDIMKAATIIQDLYDDGYMSDDDYTSLMLDSIGKEILKTDEGKSTFADVERFVSENPEKAIKMTWWGGKSGFWSYDSQMGSDMKYKGTLTDDERQLLFDLATIKAKKKKETVTRKAAKGATG